MTQRGDGRGKGRVILQLPSPSPNLPHQGGGTYLVTKLQGIPGGIRDADNYKRKDLLRVSVSPW
jgi:hypothetical protein